MSVNEKVFVNCARCMRNISVTASYKERKDAKQEVILCNGCRNQSEGIVGGVEEQRALMEP